MRDRQVGYLYALSQIGLAANPNLTSLHVYKVEMAALAVRQLLELAQSGQRPRRMIEVDVDLIERESVSAFRAEQTI